MRRFVGRLGVRSGLLMVAALAVAGGIAYASIPSGAGVYTACKLNATGTIRLIDPSLPSSSLLSHCIALESQITWSQNGQPGPAGATGPQGPQGPKGDTGATGPAGPAGADGAPGKDGATGAQGPKGDTGATGPAGPAGPAGAKGDTGDTGPQGPPGSKGDTGPAGSGAIWANIRSDGLLRQHTADVVAASEVRTGIYRVTFTRDVTTCGVNVTSSQYIGAGIIGVNAATTDPPDLSHDFFSVVQDIGTANSMVVGERNAATRALEEGPFTISVNCA